MDSNTPPPMPPCTCDKAAAQPTGWCERHKMGWVNGNAPAPAKRTMVAPRSHPIGWECPKCTAVMSPNYPVCLNCTGIKK